MSHGKQFTIYMHYMAPNSWKVIFALNILGLTYEPSFLAFDDVKNPEHVRLNPNGRVPTLIDHKNGDFVVWESDAILLYLIDTYDPGHRLSVVDPKEKANLNQWLMFQASGQGPYFGQSTWFSHFHPEKLPSAIVRYQVEARRILGVLESVLSKQDYLVGGKLTVADIAFVPWNNIIRRVIGDEFDFQKEFPSTFAWHVKVADVDGVKKGLEERLKLIAEEEKKVQA
ncbi:Glutathione S-transferase 2 [Steccherinum ochraceum]|uniref:glutathione transferase n=1 Tax=Steccherinum ochraceum TaxID=92696 RepID=A0A4R0RZU3_9APHY|nr:Glutathione S-transferase 2 [Steccherinum ochraceum]